MPAVDEEPGCRGGGRVGGRLCSMVAAGVQVQLSVPDAMLLHLTPADTGEGYTGGTGFRQLTDQP
jgi:predicted alpha/beta-hydrolase family hydrolase